MIKDYEFKNNCDLKTLIESYRLEYPKRRDMSLKIGPDGVIYILIHTATNERGYITLSLIVLDVDWDEEKITGSGCYPLGRYPADYYLAQPLEDKILLLNVRSRSNEDNAVILDLEGKAERFSLHGKTKENDIVTPVFEGRAISVIANSSYSSKALFLDDQGRLLVKRFIS